VSRETEDEGAGGSLALYSTAEDWAVCATSNGSPAWQAARWAPGPCAFWGPSRFFVHALVLGRQVVLSLLLLSCSGARHVLCDLHFCGFLQSERGKEERLSTSFILFFSFVGACWL
jgi:hypothetical protein